MKKLVLIDENDLRAMARAGNDMALALEAEEVELEEGDISYGEILTASWRLYSRPTTWREIDSRPCRIVEVDLWRGV